MVACNPPTPQLAGTLYSNRAAAALKLKLGSRWAVCTLLLPLSNPSRCRSKRRLGLHITALPNTN